MFYNNKIVFTHYTRNSPSCSTKNVMPSGNHCHGSQRVNQEGETHRVGAYLAANTWRIQLDTIYNLEWQVNSATTTLHASQLIFMKSVNFQFFSLALRENPAASLSCATE